MVDLWLTAIENVLLNCPGNADSDAGELWDSTLTRLGECSLDSARNNRCHWDYPEADDLLPSMPFFVLTENRADWELYNLRDLSANGIIVVSYCEPVRRTARQHTEAKRHFVAWTTRLIEYVASQARTAGVPIHAVRQTEFPHRTPRTQRDPSRPDSDYFWATWEIHIGHPPRKM